MLCAVAPMMQLSYQPAFDAYHTVFRLLRLRQAIPLEAALPRDHIRLLDFYLLFPFLSTELRLFKHHQHYRKLARRYASDRPYGDLPDKRVLFHRMTPIQIAALETLVKKNIICAEDYRRGTILFTPATLPKPMQVRVDQANKQDEELLAFLLTLATEYDFLGPGGLKARSNLMEYAYDAI